MTPCVFCSKLKTGGDEHGTVLSTADPGTVRFEPLNPVAPGHMLFVPRRHAEHPFNIGKAMEIADGYGQRAGADFNLIRSYGSAATQTVEHPHVHYVPRFPGDGLPLPWTPISKVTGRLSP